VTADRAASLDGLVGVVTGGNGGIGLGITRALVAAGASVAVWGRNEAKTAAAVADLAELARDDRRVLGIPCDVADEAQVQDAFARTLDRFARVDTFFANAGVPGRSAPIVDMTLDDWRTVLQVNLDGTFLCLREAARHMIERGSGGSLVAIGSTAAFYGAARKGHYSASKAAVLAVVRVLAVELARYGVRVNGLVPGWTETELVGPDAGFSHQTYDRFVENTVRRTPVRRWAKPEEYGAAAVYLADPSITYHTGDALVIDGGYTIF
jgi:NAD(P)-dependent dehydrogenase (short-subunit alcohol dehydrogenase family)